MGGRGLRSRTVSMGNRSSSTSHYPPWGYPPPDGKRHFGPPPHVFEGPYVPHPIHHRSMMSLQGGGDFMQNDYRNRMMGSRLSLHQMDRMTVVDTKTLKKMEKMEKKQRKLAKKLGEMPTSPLPPPYVHAHHYPPPAQLYSRTLSYDDLQRAHLDLAEARLREQWMRSHPGRMDRHSGRKGTASSASTALRGSLASSPVTSSSEERTDQWAQPPPSHHVGPLPRRDRQPLFTSTPNNLRRPDSKEGKTIEVKVQRSETVERTEKSSENRRDGATYAQPIVRRSGSSCSSAWAGRGDQSEIDFSWVSEEEDRLKHEKDNRSLPECYFGMEPPAVDKRKPDGLRPSASYQDSQRQEREQAMRARSISHIGNELQHGNGPAERRLHRIQREERNGRVSVPRDAQGERWRSSIAF